MEEIFPKCFHGIDIGRNQKKKYSVTRKVERKYTVKKLEENNAWKKLQDNFKG